MSSSIPRIIFASSIFQSFDIDGVERSVTIFVNKGSVEASLCEKGDHVNWLSDGALLEAIGYLLLWRSAGFGLDVIHKKLGFGDGASE